MRLFAAAALGTLLVSPMGNTDIERALSLARARDTERQQFHRRYVIDLPGPVVTQFEVITEFRRLLIIAEEHVLRGDWMFTRGVRAAEDAIKPTRGLITIKAQLRFNPLNTFVEPPAYTLAIGGPAGERLEALATQVLPQYSSPFKNKDGKQRNSLTGAGLETTLDAARVGPTSRTLAVTLGGEDAGRTTVDFARLD